MKVTIPTATITIEEKETTLTKSIVEQMPSLLSIEGCECVGTVETAKTIFYLYQTPRGVEKSRCYHTTLGNLEKEPPRIFLES